MKWFKQEQGVAFLAGASCVAGFAPFGIFPLPVLALAILFVLWLRADTPRAAAWLGFAFGLGLFSAGISWIYVALHDYGDMPALLALLGTLLFAAFLALLLALAGYVQARIAAGYAVRAFLLMPAVWVLSEWIRGLIFTGFPWLTLGYAQSGSPLAGFAPLLGVYGVSLVAAVSAGLCAYAWQVHAGRRVLRVLLVLLAIWVAGYGMRYIQWTEAQGEPLRVSLLQGNIPQELKFDPDQLISTLESYRHLVLQSDARLIVLPETALPLTLDELPANYIAIIRDHARSQAGDVLFGAFERDHGMVYNSVITLGSASSQSYRKNHLVPLGEFIPLRPALGWFINDVLDIPMGDLARGGINQAPLSVAGQKVAADICYEDAFGEEIIRQLPEATLLVNFTNDAWYGNSFAAMQHNQMSQMRALETGRMMLRATNTGVTSVIDRDGAILKMLPQHVEGVLDAEVQGYTGSTPYVRFGNAPVVLLIVLMLAAAWRLGKRSYDLAE